MRHYVDIDVSDPLSALDSRPYEDLGSRYASIGSLTLRGGPLFGPTPTAEGEPVLLPTSATPRSRKAHRLTLQIADDATHKYDGFEVQLQALHQLWRVRDEEMRVVDR